MIMIMSVSSPIAAQHQDPLSQIDDCDMWCNRWHAINPTFSSNENNRVSITMSGKANVIYKRYT